jgi:cytochrome c biogenesis protein CcdA
MMTLKQDLDRRIALSQTSARGNYRVTYVFIIVGVLASIATTISVAARRLTPEINATLATLPGIVVMILSTLRLEKRSQWWWKKHFRLIELQSELENGANESR